MFIHGVVDWGTLITSEALVVEKQHIDHCDTCLHFDPTKQASLHHQSRNAGMLYIHEC